MPLGAGPVLPAGDHPERARAERAVEDYASWVDDILAWGRRGWSRAELARELCEKAAPTASD